MYFGCQLDKIHRRLLGFQTRYHQNQRRTSGNTKIIQEVQWQLFRTAEKLKIKTRPYNGAPIRSEETVTDPIHTIAVGHGDEMIRDTGGKPLCRLKKKTFGSTLSRCETEPVDGVDDHRETDLTGGPATQDAGLGTVGVYDSRAAPVGFKKLAQFPECRRVNSRFYGTIHARDNPQVKTLITGLGHKVTSGSGHEYRFETLPVQRGDRVQGVKLSAAELQFRDYVNDRDPVHFRTSRAVLSPHSTASCMAEYSQAPYRPTDRILFSPRDSSMGLIFFALNMSWKT